MSALRKVCPRPFSGVGAVLLVNGRSSVRANSAAPRQPLAHPETHRPVPLERSSGTGRWSSHHDDNRGVPLVRERGYSGRTTTIAYHWSAPVAQDGGHLTMITTVVYHWYVSVVIRA